MTGFRPSELADVKILSSKLRKADLQEIEASTGEDPYWALLRGFTNDECFTMLGNDSVIGMFGVSKSGAIWMMCSDELSRFSVRFLRESLDVLNLLQETYPTLWNFVDARNELHIRWLKWLGFEFTELVEHGVKKLPFWKFKRCAYQSQPQSQ
jgi:hypothetical protein